METNREQTDKWSDLFNQLPEEKLPDCFQLNVMQQIRKEAARRKKCHTQMEWIGVAIASLGIIGLAIIALLYTGYTPIFFPQIKVGWISSNGIDFYLYIGLLSLLLLWADYRLRRAFGKDEQK